MLVELKHKVIEAVALFKLNIGRPTYYNLNDILKYTNIILLSVRHYGSDCCNNCLEMIADLYFTLFHFVLYSS